MAGYDGRIFEDPSRRDALNSKMNCGFPLIEMLNFAAILLIVFGMMA
jgi:hypothetical protein